MKSINKHLLNNDGHKDPTQGSVLLLAEFHLKRAIYDSPFRKMLRSVYSPIIDNLIHFNAQMLIEGRYFE